MGRPLRLSRCPCTIVRLVRFGDQYARVKSWCLCVVQGIFERIDGGRTIVKDLAQQALRASPNRGLKVFGVWRFNGRDDRYVRDSANRAQSRRSRPGTIVDAVAISPAPRAERRAQPTASIQFDGF